MQDSECRSFQGPPRGAAPGLGVPAGLGSPGCGHGAAALCRCRHGRGWALLTSCPCQEHKAPGEASPGQAGLPGVCPRKCQPLRAAPAAVEQRGDPTRMGSPGTDPVSLFPSPRSAGGWLLSPSLSPSTPHPTPHPAPERTLIWWPLARTTVTMRSRPSRSSPPIISSKLKSRSEFSPRAAPLSQTGRGQQVPTLPPLFPFNNGDSPTLCHLPRCVPGVSEGADPQGVSHPRPEKKISWRTSSAARGCPQPLWPPHVVQSPRGSGEWCCECLVLALPQG